jgi:hypothetical protein
MTVPNLTVVVSKASEKVITTFPEVTPVSAEAGAVLTTVGTPTISP